MYLCHHLLLGAVFYTPSCTYATISPSVLYFIHRHVLRPPSPPPCCISYTVMYLGHHLPPRCCILYTVMYLCHHLSLGAIFYTTSCTYATISPSVLYFIHRNVLMPRNNVYYTTPCTYAIISPSVLYFIHRHVIMPRNNVYYTTPCTYVTISPSVLYFIHRHVLMPPSLPRCCILYTVMYLCHHISLGAVFYTP